jgi:hypothetical protein
MGVSSVAVPHAKTEPPPLPGGVPSGRRSLPPATLYACFRLAAITFPVESGQIGQDPSDDCGDSMALTHDDKVPCKSRPPCRKGPSSESGWGQ